MGAVQVARRKLCSWTVVSGAFSVSGVFSVSEDFRSSTLPKVSGAFVVSGDFVVSSSLAGSLFIKSSVPVVSVAVSFSMDTISSARRFQKSRSLEGEGEDYCKNQGKNSRKSFKFHDFILSLFPQALPFSPV